MHMPETRSARRSGGWRATLPAAFPVLCAVHCLAAPLVVVFAPALAPNRQVESVLLLLSVGLSIVLLRWGVRAHGRRIVWLPAMTGLAVWAGAHVLLRGGAELAGEVVGALLLASGLLWNAWLSHRAGCSGCGAPAAGSRRTGTGEPAGPVHGRR
jgi:hypothetical protein